MKKTFISVIIAGTIVISLFAGRQLRRPVNARAKTSLPNIEAIKNRLDNNSGFSILEVTPTADDDHKGQGGTFGYLIAGSEPDHFKDTLSSTVTKTDADSGEVTDGYEERNRYANTLIKGLVSTHIASEREDAAPIYTQKVNDNDYYHELRPWEADVDGQNELKLTSEDSVYLRNLKFTKNETDGAFAVAGENSYRVAENGHYVQNITGDNPLQPLNEAMAKDDFDVLKSSYVFYKINITPRTVDEIREMKAGTAIFSKDKDADDNSWVYDYLATERHIFDENKDYGAEDGYDGLPVLGIDVQDTYDDLAEQGWYVSRILTRSPFIEVTGDQTGYFDFNASGFRYVGKGQGDYDLTVNDDDITTSTDVDAKYYILYSRIRYTGGYTNNNWFLRKVLDVDDDKIDAVKQNVHVDYEKPQDVTADANTAGQGQQFADYDMVVISCGLDLTGDEVYYGNGAAYDDAGGEYSQALKAYINSNMPVLVDEKAAKGTAFDEVDTAKAAASDYGAVTKSVYIFKRSDNYPTMASDSFISRFPMVTYTGTGSAFYDVYDDIRYENELRKKSGSTDLITQQVGESQTIRYIINYAGKRNRNRKSKLRVLDIEPENTNTLSAQADDFKTQTILKMLPGYGADDITVTTIATRTLAGLTDDLTENYDVIYIGDRNKKDSFVDTDMKGLAYYNIGDTYKVQNTSYIKMNGYMDAEYNEDKGTYDTFRNSGNDISVKKSNELESFILQGYPVIISDDLATDNGHVAFDGRITLSDPLVSQAGNGRVKLTTELALYTDGVRTTSVSGRSIGDIFTATYQWYRVDGGNAVEIPGATDRELTVDAHAGDSYECQITSLKADGNDISFNAGDEPLSNIVTIRNGRRYFEFRGNNRINNNYDHYAYQGFWVFAGLEGSNDNTIIKTDRYPQTNDNRSPQAGTPITSMRWSGTNNNRTVNGNVTDVSDWDDGDTFCAIYTVDRNKRDANNFKGYNGSQNEISSGEVTVRRARNGFSGEYVQTGKQSEINVASTRTLNISIKTVDSNSRLYRLLDKYKHSDNVMSQSAALSDGEAVVNAASTSAPVVNMIQSPKLYNANDPQSSIIGGYEGNKKILSEKKLDFVFQVINETELTPDETTYTAKVYADVNSDGVFGEGEEIIETEVSSGGSRIPADEIKGNVNAKLAPEISISAQLPENLQGAFTWKLEVTKNKGDNDNAMAMTHSSQKGVSFVGLNDLTKKIDIRVLQINKRGNNGVYNLENYKRDNYTNMGQRLNDPQVTRYYNIEIKTVSADNAENYMKNQRRDWRSYYDMLILGFGDNYGQGGPSRYVMKQVVNFIGDGKSVLFCHDNINISSLNKYNTEGKKLIKYRQDSGTWADQGSIPDFIYTLRAKAHMDVYGISDTTNRFGGQKNWSYNTDGIYENINGGILASGRQLTDAEQKELEKLGYSVAYKPKSGEKVNQTVSQVQGFATAAIYRYKHNGNGNVVTQDNMDALKTNSVQQVNKGQITSYPYEINKGEFAEQSNFNYNGQSTTMGVSQTHGQWYQLNTNDDNIVVWYTVEDGNQKNFYGHNDCVNDYYIFNCGNITYTGAGHAGSGADMTNDEAKLFVNTMIAAFRTSNAAPKASFVTDATGKKDTTIQDIGVHSDPEADRDNRQNNREDSTIKAVNEAKIFFTVTDTNMASNKKISVQFADKAERNDAEDTYTVNDGDILYNMNVYDAESYLKNGTEEQVTNLKSRKVYYIKVPGDANGSDIYRRFTDGSGQNKHADLYMRPVLQVGDSDKKTIGEWIHLDLNLSLSKLFTLG